MQPLPHRFAIYAMADGPERGPVCEADTIGGTTMAIACLANEGAPGWYVVVDRDRRPGPNTAAVHTYYAPEGVRQVDLHAVSCHRPWIDAARRDAQVA